MTVIINGTTGIVTPDIAVDGTTLTVDAVNNRVGIGTTSPATTLDVAGTGQFKNNGSALKIESVPGNNFTQVQLKNDGGSFFIGRENNSGNWFATGSNYASVLRSDGAYPLIFSVNGANRLSITSDGLVGIGTDNPGYKLHIGNGTSQANLRLQSGNSDISLLSMVGGTSQTCRIEFGDSGDDDIGKIYYDNSDNSMQFTTNTAERLRIDSNGRVLVGPGAIATPKCGYAGIDIPNYDYAIVMGGSDGNGNRANNAIKDGRFCGAHYTNAEEPVGIIRYSIGSTASEIHMGGGSSLINAATRLSFYTAANTTTTNGTERLHINSDGNIGVNKTPETDWASSYRAIEIGNSSVSGYQGGTYPSIELNMNCRGTQSSYSAGWKRIVGTVAAQIHIPYTGNIHFKRAVSGSADTDITWLESMRITNTGEVGINCSNPQRPLHIIGNDGTSGATSGNSDTTVLLDNAGGNGAMIEFLNSNTSAGHLMFTDTDGSNRGRISYHHNGDYFRIDAAGSERVHISSDHIQVKSGVGFNWHGYLIEKVGERNGSGTYSLWTNGSSYTQSSAIVEIHSIYATPSSSAYQMFKISGNRNVYTVHTDTQGFPTTPPSLAWNGSTLEVTNNNGNIYYAVKIQLFEIGIGWSPTWGNLPGL